MASLRSFLALFTRPAPPPEPPLPEPEPEEPVPFWDLPPRGHEVRAQARARVALLEDPAPSVIREACGTKTHACEPCEAALRCARRETGLHAGAA